MKKSDIREASIHFNLYSELYQIRHQSTLFDTLEAEYPVKLSNKKIFSDIVLFKNEKPVLVIECKKYKNSKVIRNIDPLSSDVIHQALNYSVHLGCPYFVTYNGFIGSLFQTFQSGKPFLERNVKFYRFEKIEHSLFSKLVLEDLYKAHLGEEEWADLDERFIARMASLHSLLVPIAAKQLNALFQAKSTYIQDVEMWFRSFGVQWKDKTKIQIESEVLPNFAKQASYVFIDKLLFYKVLEKKYKELPLLSGFYNKNLFEYLEQCFDSLLNIDYEPIFHPDPLFSKKELFYEAEEEIKEFIRDLGSVTLKNLDGNHLGKIYESLIPPKIRHDLGQYYTNPLICSLLSKWAIKSSRDMVLDPACGSGGFLSQAYEIIGNLDPNLLHREILDRLHGIEINRFPAHLSSMNLALKDLESHTNFINITVKNFFDGEITDTIGTSKVDSIIGNPPYIRQELIDNKSIYRGHLIEGTEISKRSDIYVYFITKSIGMLKEGGRLAFIVSNRWLQTEYGKKLQEFLINHSSPCAFISFDKNIFPDALIGTMCIFIERNNPVDDKIVNFIRIKKRIAETKLLNFIDSKRPVQLGLETSDSVNVFKTTIKELKTDALWRKFLYAPELYFKIVKHKKLVSLSKLVEPRRGFTTGANEFFYLKKQDIRRLGLSLNYFKPLLKSVGQVSSIEFTKFDTEWFVLDVGRITKGAANYAEKKFDLNSHASKDQRVYKVLNALKAGGHSHLVSYIQIGINKKYHENPTMKSREFWWVLPIQKLPKYAFTKECWKQFRTIILKDNILCDQHLYPLYSNPDLTSLQEEALGGVLNSNFCWLMREVHGREASGEGMSRNELTVEECETILLPDVRLFGKDLLNNFIKLKNILIQTDRAGSLNDTEEARKNIDKEIIKFLGEEIYSFEELKAAVSECLERREKAAHLSHGLLIQVKEKTA